MKSIKYIVATLCLACTLIAVAQDKVKVLVVNKLDGTKVEYPLSELASVDVVERYIHNGHEYVDLGITDDNGNPIYFATCNLGASLPEEYGNYYAWGETKAYGEEDTSNASNYSYTSSYTKSRYSWSTYKYCQGPNTTMTKYCTNNNNGTIDNKTVLESSDDAATSNWGGSWRMPTDAELTKLRNNCTWTWTAQNGVNGYKVTGSNGNSIFLPAAGFHNGSSLDSNGSLGNYWSSSLRISSSLLVNCSCFGSGSINRYDGLRRYFGLSVRPVYHPAQVKATSISLSSSTLSLKVDGPTSTLTATILPSNVSSSNIYWVSSNTDIATVSNGVVTPVDAGSCTITAITMDGTNLNASCSVTVKAAGPDANGHAYVDLGITDDNGNPIYWATCNLGASSPEEFGGYYAWGETETKSTYSWSTYKYTSNDWSGITKYTYPDRQTDGSWYKDGSFIGDNKTVLESADDAATVNWGGSWRVPSEAERDKLINNCTWTWTTQNSKDGYKVTGSNGNSIFLPAAGYITEYVKSSVGYSGYYWVNSVDSAHSYSDCGSNMDFSSGNIGTDYYAERCIGFSIRPVCQ